MKSIDSKNVNKTADVGSTPSTQHPTTAKPLAEPKTVHNQPKAVPLAQPKGAPTATPKVIPAVAHKKL